MGVVLAVWRAVLEAMVLWRKASGSASCHSIGAMAMIKTCRGIFPSLPRLPLLSYADSVANRRSAGTAKKSWWSPGWIGCTGPTPSRRGRKRPRGWIIFSPSTYGILFPPLVAGKGPTVDSGDGARRENARSREYDWRLIRHRLSWLLVASEERNFQQLVNLLRSGLVRNLGNITAPELYNRSFSGTKYLIEEYIAQVARSVQEIGALPTAYDGGASPLTDQTKLDFMHDTRQAFGRTSLVLHGGAIFGLCHLGVVKALFLRGLLPRIITGTGTGALIAALVAIHTEEELPAVLEADGIDLTAFTRKGGAGEGAGLGDPTGGESFWSRWETLRRRVGRFSREGYFLDVKVLEDCVRANVGDLTFEEAYNRSKRILNITVATGGQGEVPTLLNYITAPSVVSKDGRICCKVTRGIRVC